MAAETSAWRPPPTLRACLGGSGSDAFNEESVCRAALELCGKPAADVTVLYLGTATYDLDGPRERQTVRFVEMGATVTTLPCATRTPTPEEAKAAIEAADIILVSGGNTLYSTDRWARLGLVELLREAMLRGTVLAGGSAGALAWFDGGHSDSNDPDSFKAAMLTESAADKGGDESSGAPAAGEAAKDWSYIRVPALGFLPGILVPHHDATQSNGILRATDFDAMLLRHPGERGVCIDHWAVLVIDSDDHYRVLAVEGKPGSVAADGNFSASREGRPGMWVKEVVDGAVKSTLVPEEGRLSDILRPATAITQDPAVEDCRRANPQPE